MSSLDVVRAWKDEAYRNSLTEAQRAGLPDNPAGTAELSAAEAATVEGGVSWLGAIAVSKSCCFCTYVCVSGLKFTERVLPPVMRSLFR